MPAKREYNTTNICLASGGTIPYIHGYKAPSCYVHGRIYKPMSARLFQDEVLFTQRLLRAQGLYLGAVLDGEWGPKTEAAYEIFLERSERVACMLGKFDERSERNIRTLLVPVQETARRFLRGVRDAGFDVRIISGTRTYGEQTALYRIGRTKGGKGSIVTNARAGQSNHNFGLSWDIGVWTPEHGYVGDKAGEPVALYRQVATKAKTLGLAELEWGGDWQRFKDLPHYQYTLGYGIGTIRAKFESGAGLFK